MKDKKLSMKNTFKNLKRTYKYAKKGKGYLFIILLCNIIMAVCSVIIPILSAKEIVNLTSLLYEQLIVVVIAMFLVNLINNIFLLISNHCFNKYFYEVEKSIQLDMEKETLKICEEDMNNNSSGIFIERISNDAFNMSLIFIEVIEMFTLLIGRIGVLISMFFISKIIFVCDFIMIIVFYFVHDEVSKINYKNEKIWKNARDKNGGFISELVRGSTDIKLLNAEESFLKKSNSLIDKVSETVYTKSFVKAKLKFYTFTMRDAFDLIIILISVYLIYNNKLTVAMALVVNRYQWQIISLSDIFGDLFEKFRSYDLATNRVFEILDSNKFKKEKFGNKHIDDIKGNIKFENIAFSYNKENTVLKDVNFNIKANTTVSFVGKSGAGKTTIFNLIGALYEPDKGKIYFDNEDISLLDKDSIRSNMSIISQNPYIYNMSIKDNFKVINEKATMGDIIRVCKTARLHDFITSLKDGYDTIVGEGGVNLSGGQRQRLAIARALLQNTKIILFDEATSSLDNETQNEIHEAIRNLKGNYTILIIAHRLSTVVDSDKIFVLNDGIIEAEGTHKDLLKNNEEYKKLYEKELKSTM